MQIHRENHTCRYGCFYASVEQHDNPELKGKPIAVGGEHRGVVAAASYEARKFGVRSAMSSKIAKEKCPHLIFCKAKISSLQRNFTENQRNFFHEYTDLVEPLSLDEAYLDYRKQKNIESANEIAREIRQKFFENRAQLLLLEFR